MRTNPLLLALLLPACSQPASTGDNADVAMAAANAVPPSQNTTAAANAATATASDADYLGRWIGVEGMFLNVTRRTGGVTLEMQWDLDHKGAFPGTVTMNGIAFTRDGKAETAMPTDGNATGLKYLAGKKHCLTVKPGEGYCRD